jgi:hypothetical protein
MPLRMDHMLFALALASGASPARAADCDPLTKGERYLLDPSSLRADQQSRFLGEVFGHISISSDTLDDTPPVPSTLSDDFGGTICAYEANGLACVPDADRALDERSKQLEARVAETGRVLPLAVENRIEAMRQGFRERWLSGLETKLSRCGWTELADRRQPPVRFYERRGPKHRYLLVVSSGTYFYSFIMTKFVGTTLGSDALHRLIEAPFPARRNLAPPFGECRDAGGNYRCTVRMLKKGHRLLVDDFLRDGGTLIEAVENSPNPRYRVRTRDGILMEFRFSHPMSDEDEENRDFYQLYLDIAAAPRH